MPGGITPNGSMRWFVEADGHETPRSTNNSKYMVKGKDTTKRDQFITLTVQHPSRAANRTTFLRLLREQIDRALTNGEIKSVTLYLPVEDETSGYFVPPADDPNNYDPDNPDHWQIYVDWSMQLADLPENVRKGWESVSGKSL